jgi:hypothetical protein
VPPGPHSVDVFVPGMKDTAGEEYQCIRIPSIVFDKNHSTLLAFAECRHRVGDGCQPEGVKTKPGGTNLCSRVSTDGGVSWGALTTLAKNAGQPTATYDAIRFRVVVEYNVKKDDKCLGAGCCPNFQILSADGGASWSAAVAVTLPVTQQARAGPGVGIQLSSMNPHKPGRLINIGYHFNHSESTSYDTIWFSDDGGASWAQPQQDMQLGTVCDEAQVAELPNGDLLAMMRPTNGAPGAIDPKCPLCRRLSRSTDGGSTWGWGGKVGAWHAEPQLSGAVCMGSILGRALEGVTYVSYPNSTDGSRRGGAIRYYLSLIQSQTHTLTQHHTQHPSGTRQTLMAAAGMTCAPSGVLTSVTRASPR